ncbi:MAG: retroviral-like aspartic protease family protein [Rickettsiales bacterium]|jgi:clan AA aspartic protease (TIGR02281 family)|nr:retroviral-like aspartic protease family protein [Rickettsiales bacterium]
MIKKMLFSLLIISSLVYGKKINSKKIKVVPSILTIQPNALNQYYVNVKIVVRNTKKKEIKYKKSYRFLVDTGATGNSIPYNVALEIFGKEFMKTLKFNQSFSTAGGNSYHSEPVYMDYYIGDLVVYSVKSSVMPKGIYQDTGLLGMGFISQLDDFSIKKGVLTIKYDKYSY